MSYPTRRIFGCLLMGCAVPIAARAAGMPAQTVGKPVLTVTGHINPPDGKDSAIFDMGALESLGLDGFQTSTPWYDDPVRFDGVRMTRLLKAVGATGETVTALALNDYSTDIPVADFEKYGVILATKKNGAYMPVRDKGPLFIVYPYDTAPELKAQRFYNRSAWQVAELIVS